MTVRSAIVAMLIAFFVPLSARASGHVLPPPFVHPSDPSGGMRLTVIFPHRSYAPNTLIAAHVRIVNVSGRTVVVVKACPPINSPYVQVLDSSGNVTFPPAVPGAYPVHGCPGVAQHALPSQTSLVRKVFVLVSGTRLRAVALIRPLGVTGPVYGMVAGKPVSLLPAPPEPAPSATYERRGTALDVTLHSPVPTRGPLRYQYWERCESLNASWTPETFTWRSTSGHTIHLADPECPKVTAWHIAAGWLDHPVAFINM